MRFDERTLNGGVSSMTTRVPSEARWYLRPAATIALGVSFAWLVRSASADGLSEAQVPSLPADAIAMVHIRVADVWRGDALKEMRTLLAKAGPQALRALDERFVPALSSLDRLTIVVSAPGPREPAIGFYVTTSKPFDKEKVVGKSLADSEEEKVGALAFHVNRRLNTAVAIVDERTLLLGPANSVRTFLDK